MKKLLVFFVALTFLATTLLSTIITGAKPISDNVSGKTIQLTGVITLVNPGAPYNELPALKTKNKTYLLSGNTKDMKNNIGSTATFTGYILKGSQGLSFFYVKSYKITKKAVTPATPLPVATPNLTPSTENKVSLTGYLVVIDPEKPRLLLKADNDSYELMGSIEGMEKYDGLKIEVYGSYVYTFAPTEFPLFSVDSYKLIENPVPPTIAPTALPTTPSSLIINESDNGGYVYVKKGDEVRLVLESNPTTGYKWSFDEEADKSILLQTNYEYISDKADVMIAGAGGNEIWTFKAIETGTTVMYLSYSRPWESVQPLKSFKVKVIVEQSAPEPLYDVLKGTLDLIPEEMLPGQTKPSIYKYILVTEKESYDLRGNVNGLENYNGKEIEVTGNISPLNENYPPVFNVVSYKVLTASTPFPTPVPTPTPSTSSTIHTVISDEICAFTDPVNGGQAINGYTTISWSESTQKAFFTAKISVDQSNIISVYEFELCEVSSIDDYSIKGLYNIKKNGKIVAEKIKGNLYCLDAPVKSYFKFYSEGEKWHMSAFVTNRIDF